MGSALAGLSFAVEPDARYLGALAYLAVFGSVVGFTAYLMLVGRMGPERAAYCTVLFPIVALAVSTVYEGYHWTALAAVGLVLVVAGNLVAFDLTRRFFARRATA
jgi:drug/metabolite transporter (DMT)-like permease